MEEYEFTLSVVTPLIIQGYKKLEWRAPSIKGVLRWWFRVCGGTKEDEKSIFGSTLGNKSKAGCFRIKTFNTAFPSNNNNVIDRRNKTRIYYKLLNNKSNNRPKIKHFGFNYLLGNLDKRHFIPMNKNIKFKLVFTPLARQNYKNKLFAALWLAINLGNFGTKSRRGFGSLSVKKISKNGTSVLRQCIEIYQNNNKYNLDFNVFKSENDRNFIKNIMNCLQIINPKYIKDKKRMEIYSCSNIADKDKHYWKNWILSDGISYDLLKNHQISYLRKLVKYNNLPENNSINFSSSVEALSFIGWTMNIYRALSDPDHTDMQNVLNDYIISNNIQDNTYTSSRYRFGLPITFNFSNQNKYTIEIGSKKDKGEKTVGRFASPLIIKIIKEKDKNKFQILLIHIKSDFDFFEFTDLEYIIREIVEKKTNDRVVRERIFRKQGLLKKSDEDIISNYIRKLKITKIF